MPSRFEALAFWTLAALHLVPVWAFDYVPTQDGPAHLATAAILKDLGTPDTPYDRFFEYRAEPVPNLSSQVLLVGLLYIFPPLIAEKVLVSLYILAFAGSLRYFLGAFGPRCLPMAWVGLLFVYHRCFWLGFWNYSLGFAVTWFVLGYAVRRRETLHLPQTAVLAVLFVAAFFTHLMAYLQAVGGALWFALTLGPRRLVRLVLTTVASIPAALLAFDYLDRTGFLNVMYLRLVDPSLRWLQGGRSLGEFWNELLALDNDLFAHHAGAVPVGLFVVFLYGLLAGVSVLGSFAAPPDEDTPSWVSPALLGLLLLVGYVLPPNHLGFEHGGFLKPRLALLPGVILLACFREPPWASARVLLRVAVALLVGLNLLLVTRTVQQGNAAIAEYTAGLDAAGTGQVLFVSQPELPRQRLADPLLHAADYYTMGTGSVNLDNYQASVPHFPLRFKRGVERGWGDWRDYPDPDVVTVVLMWESVPGRRQTAPAGWVEVFSQDRLRLFRRP